MLDNGIAIEHACDMSCACTTCHVIVREGFASGRDGRDGRGPARSRLQPAAQLALGCQAILAQQDLVVEIPKYTINHARENH